MKMVFTIISQLNSKYKNYNHSHSQADNHNASRIHQSSKWNWVVDENNHPYCLPQLEALIDSIVKRSVGGEA
jgi:hypothetical protein